jgi:hypothetical protein
MLWKTAFGYGQKDESDSRRRAAADAENPADASQAAWEEKEGPSRADQIPAAQKVGLITTLSPLQ